jgi:pyruvate dehydrogenase E2 component (dihydrolipoamide acetyltransferase)
VTRELAVNVPDIGDFENVDVIEVLVQPGERVEREASLITLETDKAAMDVPAPAAGVVRSVQVKRGDKVSEGSPILVLEVEDAQAAKEGRAPSPTGAAPGGEAAETSTGATPAKPAASASAPPAAPARPSAPATPQEVSVPDLGDFKDVDVIEVHVEAGDEVAADASLITLETDKAAMDVPAPFAGTITEVKVAVGAKVSKGDLIALMQPQERVPDAALDAARAAPASAATASAAAPAAPKVAQPKPAARPAATLPVIDEATFGRAHAGPSVRKFARELGVDLGRVKGSGTKARITQDDVKAFVKALLGGGAAAGPALPAVAKVDYAKFGKVEVKPLGRVQRISGPRLQAAWINVPHVTQHDEADITDLEAQRQRMKPEADAKGVKLTPLAFLVRACALALAEFPLFKTSLDADGQSLVWKQYTHIGFAADTPNGLVVPVLRDADAKDVYAIARELGELAAKAREGKLKAEEMQGGCFTISSLGGIGGTAFTPIVNAPEVAILGVSRSRMAPVWRDDAFVPRLMLPLSLSYDHRVIDGAAAARFTTWLAKTLAEVEPLLA